MNFIDGMEEIKYMLVKRILFSILIIALCFVIWENTKSIRTINYTDIDRSKEYIICQPSTASESEYDIIYDSKDRDVLYVNLKNSVESMFKFSGYFNDGFSSYLNTYVVYGDFDYNLKSKELLISNFKMIPLDKVERYEEYSLSNNKMPSDGIYRYEYSWIVRIFEELLNLL